MEIGFIGLGNMGSAVASNLLKAGHELTVWNRTPEKAEALMEEGAILAHDPAGTAGGDIVITLLSDDHAVRTVVLQPDEEGNSFLNHQSENTIHISMSTISPALSREITEASKAVNRTFVSATVMGRPDVAQRAELVVMAAGAKKEIEKCKPVFEAIEKVSTRSEISLSKLI